jgi:hypothetical protein
MRIQPVDKMQIAMAHASRGGADQHFMFVRIVNINLLNRQGLMGTPKNCSLHFFHRPSMSRRSLSQLCLA